MNSIGLPELLIIFAAVAMVIVVVWPMMRICEKAGFPSWYGLFGLVPVANVLLLWFLAFVPWPAMDAQRA
jgi:hypothetical protein